MKALNLKGAQIYLFFLTITLMACKHRQEPDVSNIQLDIKIERFDQSLDSLTAYNLSEKHSQWQKKYDQFYSDFITHMLQAGNLQDTSELFNNYRKILQSRDFIALKKSISQTYPTLNAQEEQLTIAFKHLKYYFPNIEVPKFIAFFSGFTVQSPINEHYIGIGLDMFLGANSPFYPALIKSIPLYISRRFTQENIVPRTVETYLREELFPEPDKGNPSMLDLMLYNGKIMYLMDRSMPLLADSLKIGYTAAQTNWANTYEKDIWAWFLEENLLYETDYYKIQKHFGEAPFTPELGSHNESAPKLGIYLGWQIVKKYMEAHPQTSLMDLLRIEDAQQLLRDARYKGIN
ncbi:gliding motility lipoprotein GldB [Olivibacter jilunii]|uniref:gliding motility lipoprotein GldB n=1 Tax=Olivibacter jilunii TaxID=985016 RepID=UPI003F1549BD